jgi:hypothetical protein
MVRAEHPLPVREQRQVAPLGLLDTVLEEQTLGEQVPGMEGERMVGAERPLGGAQSGRRGPFGVLETS